jgi:hypothetical protein
MCRRSHQRRLLPVADPTKGCRLAPVALTSENWQAGGTGAPYVKYTGGDEVQLTLIQDRGPRWGRRDGLPGCRAVCRLQDQLFTLGCCMLLVKYTCH